MYFVIVIGPLNLMFLQNGALGGVQWPVVSDGLRYPQADRRLDGSGSAAKSVGYQTQLRMG
jgi:hypothetical protein